MLFLENPGKRFGQQKRNEKTTFRPKHTKKAWQASF
jgi:hypothetical protein